MNKEFSIIDNLFMVLFTIVMTLANEPLAHCDIFSISCLILLLKCKFIAQPMCALSVSEKVAFSTRFKRIKIRLYRNTKWNCDCPFSHCRSQYGMLCHECACWNFSSGISNFLVENCFRNQNASSFVNNNPYTEV